MTRAPPNSNDVKLPSTHELRPYTIVTYSLSSLDHVKKTQFGYALRGRDGASGLIRELKGKMLGRNCFRIPSESFSKIEEFMAYWKAEYESEQAYYNKKEDGKKG